MACFLVVLPVLAQLPKTCKNLGPDTKYVFRIQTAKNTGVGNLMKVELNTTGVPVAVSANGTSTTKDRYIC